MEKKLLLDDPKWVGGVMLRQLMKFSNDHHYGNQLICMCIQCECICIYIYIKILHMMHMMYHGIYIYIYLFINHVI